MSKEKIKQEINSLNKQDLYEIKEFIEHLSTSDGKNSSDEYSFEDKKIVHSEYLHQRAAEKLDKLSQSIEEQELGRIYNQVHLIKKDMCDLPDFSSAISYAIARCLKENASISDSKTKVFALVQLLEDIYDEKPITKFYTQNQLDEEFTKAITDLTSNHPVDTDLQGEVNSIYSDL